MKATAAESAELKQRFKEHFRVHGYDAPLPHDLHTEMADFPNEWAEACQEWEDAMTFDEAQAAFHQNPCEHTAKQYSKIACQYWDDDMIGPATYNNAIWEADNFLVGQAQQRTIP